MMAGRPYRRYHVLTMARMEMWRHFGSRCAILTGAFYAGLLDGLLGVAGMMNLIVSQWIIPENALRLAPVRLNKPIHGRYNSITPIEMKIFQPLMTVEH